MRPTVRNVFRHEPGDLAVAIHGDDLVREGEGHQLDYLDGVLDNAIELKRIGRINWSWRWS